MTSRGCYEDATRKTASVEFKRYRSSFEFDRSVGLSVGPFVHPLLMSVNFGKTAEAIKLLFGMVNVVGLMEWCVTWRHLANTVERLFVASATKDGDTACSQIIL